ncbi:ABC-type sugar transport system, periplasmic component [Pseudomonas sp. GM78]|uniref:sugar ABC transporter substrate-binding protein n=1 Tax=Pseudomonas sp. GM78 TaxID=1144337 RepID=UPI000270628E|nr:sugar ABC transporter substrate-binding protein [Pseudomonas sp. GM78]EJN22026.1 ABC-type sugar transport system, periplasmic component [Pseudomonas sp. GM78]
MKLPAFSVRVLWLPLLGCLMSCGVNAQTKPVDQITVGMSIPSLQWVFYLMVRDGVMEQAKGLGINNVLVADAQADPARQVSQIQDMLSKGIDVLLYTATGSAASAVPVRLARQQGVPVICIDNFPKNVECDAYISTDNLAAAGELARQMIKLTGGKAEIGLLQGTLGDSTEVARAKGLDAVLSEAPEMKIVDRKPTDWLQDNGFKVAQDMLQKNPKINVFIGRSDAPALGAAQAVKVANIDHKVWVFGYDGLPSALEAMRDGKLDMTITQQAVEMGRTALRTAVDLQQGKPVTKTQLLPAFVTTRENVATFLEQHP